MASCDTLTIRQPAGATSLPYFAAVPTPNGSVTVAKVNYPIESFIEAFDAFDLSIEIRERLTRPEIKIFDTTLVTKLNGLKTMSVEGPHHLQLKVLKRLTRAREHLKIRIPSMVEDLSKLIWNLLLVLAGHIPNLIAQPVAYPLSDTASSVDVIQAIQAVDKLPLSSITIGHLVVERSAGYDLYLHFIDAEASFEVKGVTAKDHPQFSNMKIKCMDVKCVGELSNTEVSVGMRDGREILLEFRDQQDATSLLKKITQAAGITAYDARY